VTARDHAIHTYHRTPVRPEAQQRGSGKTQPTQRSASPLTFREAEASCTYRRRAPSAAVRRSKRLPSHLRGPTRSRSHLLLRSAPLPGRPFRACTACSTSRRAGRALTFEALLHRRVRSVLASSLMPELPVLPWALCPSEMFPMSNVPAGSHQLLHRGGGLSVSRHAAGPEPYPVTLADCRDVLALLEGLVPRRMSAYPISRGRSVNSQEANFPLAGNLLQATSCRRTARLAVGISRLVPSSPF
jgi:hypothetical protein